MQFSEKKKYAFVLLQIMKTIIFQKINLDLNEKTSKSQIRMVLV